MKGERSRAIRRVPHNSERAYDRELDSRFKELRAEAFVALPPEKSAYNCLRDFLLPVLQQLNFQLFVLLLGLQLTTFHAFRLEPTVGVEGTAASMSCKKDSSNAA